MRMRNKKKPKKKLKRKFEFEEPVVGRVNREKIDMKTQEGQQKLLKIIQDMGKK